jgi:hypothetical protein
MTKKYSTEERREDPELKEQCRKVIEARRALMLKAAKALEELVREMRPLQLDKDDAHYERSFDALWSAHYRMGADAEFLRRLGVSDTYLGNKAVGDLGDYLLENGLPKALDDVMKREEM